MKLSPHIRTSITLLLLAALISGIIFLQKKHDDFSPPFSTKLKAVTRNLMSDSILPYVTFGFTNIITDIYWLRAVQDLTVWDGRDPYYLNYFRNISALDPTFEYPYLFSILVVPKRKNVEVLNDVATIAERGITNIPQSWQIPFYLGTQYFQFTRQYSPADHYLGIAASREGAPEGVYLLYSTYVAKRAPQRIQDAEDAIIAKELFSVIYNNTTNETIKKMAENGIEEYRITNMLRRGIVAFNERFKRYPKNPEELLSANLISLPPEFLEYFTIEINQNNGSFTITEKEFN